MCYKLIGYPPDYKFKKKTGSYIKENETSKGNPNPSDIGNQLGGQSANFAGSSHMSKGSTDAFGAIPQFTKQQYKQILTMLDSEKSEADHVALTAGMIPHTTITSDCVKWIVDSGASSHMVSSVELLSHTTTVNNSGLGKVHLPTGNVVNVTHTTSSCLFPGQEITNVMHIPEFKYNLLSVSQLTKELQCAVLFYPDSCILQDLSSGKVKGIGKEENGLYVFQSGHKKAFTANVAAAATNVCSSSLGVSSDSYSMSMNLWHKRLGHTSSVTISKLLGPTSTHWDKCIKSCNVCPLAKQTRLSFPLNITTSECYFQLVNGDVWGPYRVTTHNGKKILSYTC